MSKRGLVVIGLGKFGMSFLKSVRDSEFDVLAIDTRPDAVDRVASWVSRAVVADATDFSALESLGMKNIDHAIVSMGGEIDQSILAVLHLRQLGVPEISVKAVSVDHARILELIGATRIIHPEREVAEQLAHNLTHPSIRQYLPLLGEFAIVEIATPPQYVGKSLRDLHLRNRHGVSVIAVGPASDPSRLMAPSVETPLGEGSLLVMIGKKDALDRFERSVRDRTER